MAKQASDAVVKELRAFGLGYPGAALKSPWPGHKDLAVKDKTFAYLSIEGEPFSMSCKLPPSFAGLALTMPFVTPTGYGLGKSGWVTATFGPRDNIPVDLLKTWINESYRLQAPKKLVASLDEVAFEASRNAKGPGARPAPAKVATGTRGKGLRAVRGPKAKATKAKPAKSAKKR